MKSVIVAWCNSNEKDFEDFVPLQFIGKRNLELGFKNNFNILFLDGFNLLSERYKDSLKDLGFTLHNAYYEFSKLSPKYSALNRFSDYEKKCFLRWLVIDKIFFGEAIIHYDGDVIFNEDPTIIAEKVKGKTFLLQGAPAFAVIHNKEWFVQYIKQLDLFVENIDNYSKVAWKKRTGWEVTFKTRWADSRFREIISSDQDFLAHLIHTRQILQDSVEDILFIFNNYMLFANPLFIHFYDENFPYNYFREKGIDYFSYARRDAQDCFYKKKVLFWHMQSCFNFYLSKFIFRKKYLKLVPMGRLEFNASSRGFEDNLNKKFARFLNHTSRLNVYKYFFEKYDFSEIFKDRVWWKKGVFN